MEQKAGVLGYGRWSWGVNGGTGVRLQREEKPDHVDSEFHPKSSGNLLKGFHQGTERTKFVFGLLSAYCREN